MTISQKIVENKEEKESKLLKSGFELFTEKGVKETSVQEIASRAGVAKGTFYLYFKDKYDLQNHLIVYKSRQLLNSAYKYMEEQHLTDYKDKIITVINYIVDVFIKNRLLLKFISKNLSMGLFTARLNSALKETESDILEKFKKGASDSGYHLANPEVTLYMIVELTSSTVFSSITSNKPLPIKEFKPYLYAEIRKMLS